jgi:hypothetical protein
MFKGINRPEANFYVCVAKQSCYTSSLFAYRHSASKKFPDYVSKKK